MKRATAGIPFLIILTLMVSGCFLKPVSVTGLDPVSGSEADNSAAQVRLTWESVTGATGYYIQTSEDEEFTSEDPSILVNVSPWSLPDPDSNPKTIYWRVKPVFKQFWKRGGWSEPAVLTVSHPPVELIALKSLKRGQTYKNTAGLPIEWEAPIPRGSKAEFEIFKPGSKEVLWKESLTGGRIVSFSDDIKGLEPGETPIRLGIRYHIVNRFGEVSSNAPEFIFRIEDPWLPVNLAEELHPDFSGADFTSIYTERGICLEETVAFPDRAMTSRSFRIPKDAEVTIVSDFPNILVRGPGGLQRYILPQVEIKYENRTCYINGDNLVCLNSYKPDYSDAPEPGIRWSVEMYPDTDQDKLYLILGAELYSGDRTLRYTLFDYRNPDDLFYILPYELLNTDIDNDGVNEYYLNLHKGPFPQRNRHNVYTTYGGMVFKNTGTEIILLVDEVYTYRDESNGVDLISYGYYLYKDLDHDGIRETLYHAFINLLYDMYTNKQIVREVYKRDPSTGLYGEPVKQELEYYEETETGWTSWYEYEGGDIQHLGGK